MVIQRLLKYNLLKEIPQGIKSEFYNIELEVKIKVHADRSDE